MNINMVTLAGRITREVELSYLASGTAVAKFGMAINKKYTKQGGEKVEKACFVECVCFSKRGEVIQKYHNKGDEIFVTGSLEYSSWEKDGVKRNKLSVMVENFEFVKSGNKNGQQDSRPAQEQGGYNAPPQNNAAPGSLEDKYGIEADEDTPPY